jgi:hypothetical protein
MQSYNLCQKIIPVGFTGEELKIKHWASSCRFCYSLYIALKNENLFGFLLKENNMQRIK